MKKLLIFFTAILLIACSDESGVNQAATPKKRTSVSSKYELGACNEQNSSELVFVTNENTQYLCNGIEWSIIQDISTSPIDDSQTIIYNSSSSFSDSYPQYLFSSSATTPPVEVVNDRITDPRDGQSYRVTTIGSQVWMAENLNYETDNSLCYHKSLDSCAKYGRLYRYYISQIRYDTTDFRYGYDRTDPCPSGWHVSTATDWRILFETVGIIGATGQNVDERIATLKATSSDWGHWHKDWPQQIIATDLYGFSILTSGSAVESYDLNYFSFRSGAVFWMGLYIDSGNDHSACMRFGFEGSGNCAIKKPQNSLVYIWDLQYDCECSTTPRSAEAASIRCVKDSL